MMRRVIVVAILTAALAAVFAATALAVKPQRGPAASSPFNFPAGMVCPFAVYAEPAENRQVETIFSSGKVQYTGFFAARVVNLANSKEARFVVPGPVRITEEGSLARVTTSGPVLFFFFPGDAGPGDDSIGRTYLFHGRTETLLDPATFAFLSFEYVGRVTDVCAQLA